MVDAIFPYLKFTIAVGSYSCNCKTLPATEC